MRVFQACEQLHSWSPVSVSRRSVMVERMIEPGASAPEGSPRSLQAIAKAAADRWENPFTGTDREGSWDGTVSSAYCPFARSGPDPGSRWGETCLVVDVTSEDLPAVMRALADRLADFSYVCVPMLVNLGVPEACLNKEAPVSGR
jgi:hypothetical protein